MQIATDKGIIRQTPQSNHGEKVDYIQSMCVQNTDTPINHAWCCCRPQACNTPNAHSPALEYAGHHLETIKCKCAQLTDNSSNDI